MPPRRGIKKSTWAAGIGLGVFMAVVIYRSLQIPGFQCEVCIAFHGATVCRTVEGATEMDARSAAITNACAHLASGVTDTMACERQVPTRVSCAPLG